MGDYFLGYGRPDGSVGVRNHVAVLSTTYCAEDVAKRISDQVKGSVALGWYSCDDAREQMASKTLVGLARNPNVAATLVVGLGCETIQAGDLANKISEFGKPVKSLVIQDKGGTVKSTELGVKMAREMTQAVSTIKREPFDVKNLFVGLQCGGSDTTSGIAANPATGFAMDKLVDAGGTVIFGEHLEMYGGEHILAKRAVNSDVANRIYEIVERARQINEDRCGVEAPLMGPGNIEGGLTTIEEKALGAILKAGTRQIQGVLECGEKPRKSGLYITNGLHATLGYGHGLGTDIGGADDCIAHGAQLIVLTTGRGNVQGHMLTPTLKVCGNPDTYVRMEDDMDLNAGEIIRGNKSVRDVGEEIFKELIAVASGKMTKSEALGHAEFQII